VTAVNLKQKTVLFVTLIVAALLFIYVVFSNYYVRQQENQFFASRLSTVALISQEFGEFFSRGSDRLIMIAELPGLVYSLQTLDESRQGKQIPAWTTLHYLVYESDVFSNGIFLVSKEGKVLWNDPPDVSLLNTPYPAFSEIAWTRGQGTESGATFTLWKGPAGAEVLLSTPLNDDEGNLVATLVGAIPVSHPSIHAILERNLGGFGDAHLMDAAGRIIASTDAAMEFRTLGYWEGVSQIWKPSILTYNDALSGDTIVAAARIVGSPWTVAIDRNAAEAMAGIQNLKWLLTGFGFVFTLVAMSSLLFILRSFTKPIEMLTADARRIGNGDLSGGFTLDRNDEIGVLAKSLDDMKFKLRSSYELLMRSEKMALMGQIVSGLAHELNNPLTIVIGNVQLMRMREHNEKNLQALARVQDGAERASKIVKNLLTFARQEKPERKQTDINAILTKTLDLRVYELKVSNIEVSSDLQAGLPQTMADPHQLQQAFLNLIVNAEQAMIEAHGKGLLRIKSRLEGDRILITFSDDGPGIPIETINRIFEPFFTTKPVGKGTGLGLSICQGIVLEHGGKIDVDSNVGRGTTFIVELPVRRLAQADDTPQPAISKSRVTRKKILVVEDEVQIRDLLVDVMKGQGHSVDTVGNGKLALEMIDRTAYDLILTDVKMPELSGRELYASIKRRGSALEQRVVFVTGDLMNAETMQFVESTGRSWLGKPFDIDSISKTVADCLQ
jgi:signal transduction histidine kinase/CheY-like chemotaxis protein